MKGRLAVLGLVWVTAGFGQYSYDYSKSPVIQDSARWSTNGGSNVSVSDVLTFSGTGGSLIDLPAISGANSGDYEVKSTLAGLPAVAHIFISTGRFRHGAGGERELRFGGTGGAVSIHKPRPGDAEYQPEC